MKLVKRISIVLCLCLMFSWIPLDAFAAEAAMAESIGSVECVTDSQGFHDIRLLFDGNTFVYMTAPKDSFLRLEHEQGIASAYLVFNVPYGTYVVRDNESQEEQLFGTEGFLHAFLDLEEAFGYAPKSVTICFHSGEVSVNELMLFTSGQVPDYVQKWEQPPEGGVDLMLFSTHGDDEQIYFAGLLPTYAGERGYEVLVVYLTDHSAHSKCRRHEMLDGLWAIGVTNYPVFGQFADCYAQSREWALLQHAAFGETEEKIQSYIVKQLRRYKPQVVVGHDPINGEYGHGQHIIYADMLQLALESAEDPKRFTSSSCIWGTWQVPKAYLHLWPENPIVMDWDQPLEAFGGLTAFQVNKYLGYPCHVSQYYGFSKFFEEREKATQVTHYSPCQYGLYRTTVGLDTGIGDMFEHITPYAQQSEADSK